MSTAGRPVGIQELLRAGGFNPGEQTAVKRVLRDLVKAGALTRDGKRFVPADEKPKAKSGPAWGGKPPAIVRATHGVKPKARKFEPEPPPKQPQKKGPPPTRSTRGGKTVIGIIHHHRDGFAFVKPIVGQDSEDLFIPPDETRKTLDNDQVVVEIVPGQGGRTAGRVIEVTSRTRQLVVGTYEENARQAWVEPREKELGNIRVPKTQLARPGDVVKVRLGVGTALFQGSNELTGEVAGSLGSADDHSIEVLSVAFSKGFHDEFPPEVMDEADAIPLEVSETEARTEHRRDLRKLPLITIDGEDARDFDDAVYCESHARGTRLVVAIADVSHYVQQDTALDAEALRRATSVYLPSRVLPMLPERLSNGICSLKPDVDRLCMVADMVIDPSGVTLETEVYPGVMRSAARCTYTEVHDVLAGEKVPGRTELKPQFDRLYKLSTTLTAMRLARGAIDFDLPEQKVELKEDGLPDKLVRRERWESHRLVEECMLAANEAVARFFREKELPTVNRYHGDPDEERQDMFLKLLGAYGITPPPGDFTSKSMNEVLKQLEGHPEQRALNQLALRSMMQAVYSSKNTGHYGLGAEDYLHFTSPIRRYPDLLVHRLLKELWGRGKKRPSDEQLEEESERLEALSVQCSERERAAMQVEREVNQLYSCLLLKDRVGEEHPGVVCGLSENGFFVQLDELWVEGFVRGESVFPDFEFDQSTYRINFGNGLVVKVGLPCKVQIASVNMERKQIDYAVVELEGAEVEVQEFDSSRPPARGKSSRGGERERGGGRAAKGGGGRFGAKASQSRAGAMKAVSDRFAGPKPKSRFGAQKPSSRFGGEERGAPKSRFGGEDRGTPKAGRFGAKPQGAAKSSSRFGDSGADRKYRSQDRGGRFGKSEVPASARPTHPNPGRGGSRTPGSETADSGSTRRFDRAPAEDTRPSRRFGEKSGGRMEQRRRESPPPQAWEKKKPAAESSEEELKPKGGFDVRATLDRLWKERGGGGGKKR
ncbi:MAG: ribonuclease R [Archangium sp.]|nr:ribonuclease R [Archangium sp.]MDP3571872.1 ribonuclease R [Archangium sp.]